MKNQQNTRRGFTQNVSYTGENGLFSSPLEGEDVRRTDEGGTKPNQYILHSEKNVSFTPHPAFGRPLPQGARGATRGFTLIELLVVVLIIGILAAVALPQYNKAVLKAQIAEYEIHLSALGKAAAACKLAKGETCTIDELDVEVPECSISSQLLDLGKGGYFTRGSTACSYKMNDSSVSVGGTGGYMGSSAQFFTYYYEPTRVLKERSYEYVENLHHNDWVNSYATISGLYCAVDYNGTGTSCTNCSKVGFPNRVAMGPLCGK